MNVKLVLLAFAAVIYQANGQFSFGNGGFGQGGGLFSFPSIFSSMFRPPPSSNRPPSINTPTFGSNQGISPLFFPFLSQFMRPPRPQINPIQEPVRPPVRPPFMPPTDFEDAHSPEYVSPEDIENERPAFPQSRPDSFEVNEPVAIVEVSEPGVSTEEIVAVPVAPPQEPINVSEENIFKLPEEESGNVSEDFLPQEEDLEEEDLPVSQDIVNENNSQQVPINSPPVEIEEELPAEIPAELF